MIRAVIVDDEAPARKRLQQLLEVEPDVVVIAECADGEATVRVVMESRPDLLFLDVRMPDMNGLEVLRAVGPDRVPAVVLVTALSDHALDAYELRAIDYLVKPFTRARFAETMTRVRRILSGGFAPDDRDLNSRLDFGLGAGDLFFPVRTEGRLILLRQSEIVRVEGAGRSILVHTEDAEHVQRGSLTEAIERLDPRRFMRVHNSHIVNLERVLEVQPHGHGDYRLVLDGGSVVPVSRSRGERLRERIGV